MDTREGHPQHRLQEMPLKYENDETANRQDHTVGRSNRSAPMNSSRLATNTISANNIPKMEIVSPIPSEVSAIAPNIEPVSPPPAEHVNDVPKMAPFSPVSSQNCTFSAFSALHEYEMLPINSNGRLYKLVYEGFAPFGYQNNPAWQQYPIDGSVYYQNNVHHLSFKNIRPSYRM